MWTLIGRVSMNIFQREDSEFFFMKVFVKYTNPLINKDSDQYKLVITKGYNIAEEGMKLNL